MLDVERLQKASFKRDGVLSLDRYLYKIVEEAARLVIQSVQSCVNVAAALAHICKWMQSTTKADSDALFQNTKW